MITERIAAFFGDRPFKFLTYQLPTVGYWPTVAMTGNGEQNQENHSIITSFLENKSREFNVKAHDQTESFSHYKIVKHKEKIGLRELYDYFYNYLI